MHTQTHTNICSQQETPTSKYTGGWGGGCPLYSHTLLICSQQETPTSKCTGGWLSVPCTLTHYSYAPNRRLPHPNVQGGWLSVPCTPTHYSYAPNRRLPHPNVQGGGCLSLVLPHTTYLATTRNCSTLLSGKRLGSQT